MGEEGEGTGAGAEAGNDLGIMGRLCLEGSEDLTPSGAICDNGSQEQTSLKWYSRIAVLSGTLAPAGTFLENTDKICAAH